MSANIWQHFTTEELRRAQLLDESRRCVGTLHGRFEVEHRKLIPPM